jgi:ubiquinone/menaquinone biosynthesis C-methylase UbiE
MPAPAPPDPTRASVDPRGGAALTRVLEPEVMDSELEALDYDRMEHDEVNARFVDDLLRLDPDLTRVLDFGTGTARIPIALCRRAGRVRIVGIDLARHMLALGSANVERAALSGVIALELRDAKMTGFPAASFTSVISNSIVHHIPSPFDALAEMARVLAPSGWLFVRDLLRPASDAAVAELAQRYAGSANDHQRALFEASLRAALSLDEVSDLARRASLERAALAPTSDRHWTLAWRKP